MIRLVPLVAPVALALGACVNFHDGPPAAPGGGGNYKVGKPYVIDGVRYVPHADPDYDRTGMASWYGPGFHGKRTANGEIYDMDALTAAHPTLPMPSRVRVTNLENGRNIVLRINDRGPFAKGRIIDVSRRAARELGFQQRGVTRVRVKVLDSPAFAAVEREAPAGGGGSSSGGSLFVQVGYFSDSGNADRLRAKLRRTGPFAVSSVSTDAGLRHRVRAGPLRSRAEAQDLLAAVHAAGYGDAFVIGN